MRILIIGGGNMGFCLASNILDHQISHPDRLVIVEKNPERIDWLHDQQLCKVVPDASKNLFAVDFLILCVKPQDAGSLFQQIAPWVQKQTAVVSIMAGVSIAFIRKELGVDKVIRCMPNLPLLTSHGMSVYTASTAIARDPFLMKQAERLFSTGGEVLYVQDEKMIDAATAVSGSGPAYVYYFMECMIRAARELGFSPEESEKLVVQTFAGAVSNYRRDHITCAEWIRRVASKGGTTEAAVSVFQKRKIQDYTIFGIKAAYKRARELRRLWSAKRVEA